nr:hypothetical protein [uncultured Trichococcus sp.]
MVEESDVPVTDLFADAFNRGNGILQQDAGVVEAQFLNQCNIGFSGLALYEPAQYVGREVLLSHQKVDQNIIFAAVVAVSSPNVDMFPFIQAYQKINQHEAAPQYDLSLNEFYGVALDNQEWTTLGEKQMLVGTASNANGVMMKLAAVKDLAHWNYKPEAAFIWDFFEEYQRNTDNGELIINSSEE